MKGEWVLQVDVVIWAFASVFTVFVTLMPRGKETLGSGQLSCYNLYCYCQARTRIP